eukprot:6102880-Prymnesium_polylepis.1
MIGCPDAPDSDGESEHDSTPEVRNPSMSSEDEDDRHVVGWSAPADAADVDRHSPVAKTWWLIEAPDGQYRGVREFGIGEWG